MLATPCNPFLVIFSLMASAKSYLLFLSIFSLACALGAAQSRQSNISLDASLRPPTKIASSWLAPNGRFAFGFYPEGTGFFVGIWLVGSSGNITIIWTANRDDPPVTKDAVLKLTNEGLKLDERLISQISTGTYAYSASILDSGNFVIYDSQFNVIWESFDHPTDTIMAGQVLNSGSELVSSMSEINHSSGRFLLAMQSDGNLVLYPEDSSHVQGDASWASVTNGSYIRLHLDDNGWLYLVGGNLTYNLTSGFPSKATLAVYRATLSVDGIFRLYSHDFESNDERVLVQFPTLPDNCQVKGICGVNSYCNSTNGTTAVCLCLPGFVYVDPNYTFKGCRRNFTIPACDSGNDNTTYMSALKDVTWQNDPYGAPMSMDDCSEACRKDCNCHAALFLLGDTCTKQQFPLKYGRRDSDGSGTTFIKRVNISAAEGTPVTKEHTEGTPVKKEHSAMILIVSLAVIAAGIASTLAVLIFFAYYRRQAGRCSRTMGRNKEPDLVDEIAPRSFSYRELREATDDFKDEIGKGAFGTVFKGIMPGGGEKAIAVKRLDRLVDEGLRDFHTEMRAIGRTHHKNLVRLLGFSDEGSSNRLLVYEYMSNGSLADLIFKTERRPSWDERVRIALDVAKGIHYLHEECDMRIIHCDIKPQNILMDGKRTAKLSDFGLAKLLTPSQTRTFTRIRGTWGYLAPEWHKNAPISVKADVYSFGIVLLETVCCRKNLDLEAEVDAIVLLDWVYKCLLAGELEKLISDEVDMTELTRIVKVGLWCVQSEPASRPAMKNVVMMLEGNIDISLPPPPDCNS